MLLFSTLLKQMRSSSLLSAQRKEKGGTGLVKERLTGGTLRWPERFRVWGADGGLLVAQ